MHPHVLARIRSALSRQRCAEVFARRYYVVHCPEVVCLFEFEALRHQLDQRAQYSLLIQNDFCYIRYLCL